MIHDNVFVSSHVVISGYCEVEENCFLGVNSSLANNITIARDCLIGMGATILDGAKIGNQCLIGAKALVTKNTQIPDGSLVLGAPAEIARPLRPEERAALKTSAERYAQNAAYCLKHEVNVSSPKSRYLFWEQRFSDEPRSFRLIQYAESTSVQVFFWSVEH